MRRNASALKLNRDKQKGAPRGGSNRSCHPPEFARKNIRLDSESTTWMHAKYIHFTTKFVVQTWRDSQSPMIHLIITVKLNFDFKGKALPKADLISSIVTTNQRFLSGYSQHSCCYTIYINTYIPIAHPSTSHGRGQVCI